MQLELITASLKVYSRRAEIDGRRTKIKEMKKETRNGKLKKIGAFLVIAEKDNYRFRQLF